MGYKNIIKGFSKVKFPESCPSDLVEVIKSLCRKKPEERVTMQRSGVGGLQEMPFFSSISWLDLAEKKVDAPYVPPPFDLSRIKSKTLERDFDLRVESIKEWDGSLPEGPGESVQRETIVECEELPEFPETPSGNMQSSLQE